MENLKIVTVWDLVGDVEFEESCKIIKDVCKDGSHYYYARPKESFFVSEGVKLATEAGAKVLILEDLS